MTTSGENLPAPYTPDQSLRPLEVGVRDGQLELSVMTRDRQTELLAEAAHTVAYHYYDELMSPPAPGAPTRSPKEVDSMGRKLLTSVSLATRLRGHDRPFEPGVTEPKRPAEVPTIVRRVGQAILDLGPMGPTVVETVIKEPLAPIDTPMRQPESRQITLRGAEVDFALNCLEEAAAILDAQANDLAATEPPTPERLDHYTDKQWQHKLADAEHVRKQWGQQVAQLRRRAQEMREL